MGKLKNMQAKTAILFTLLGSVSLLSLPKKERLAHYRIVVIRRRVCYSFITQSDRKVDISNTQQAAGAHV